MIRNKTQWLYCVAGAVGLVTLAGCASLDIAVSDDAIKPGELVSLLLTATLIAITGIYVHLTQNIAKASAEANRINFRPYITIGDNGYGVGQDPQGGESLVYRIQNVGTVPAVNVRHMAVAEEIDEDTKVVSPISLEGPVHTHEEVLFPNQVNTRVTAFPKGAFYRVDHTNRRVRVKIRVSYRNEGASAATYYSSATILCRCAAGVDELNAMGPNTVSIESTDWGIQK